MHEYVRTACETSDSASEQSWGRLEWLAGGTAGRVKDVIVGRVMIKSGCQNPRHRHTKCAEVLHVLSGRLKHTIGDEHVTLEPGDTIVVPAGVYHNAVNTGEQDSEMLIVFNSNERDFEHESE